jgi:hypothetical protein
MSLLGMATRIATEGDVSLVHALVRWRFVAAGDLARALAETLSVPITPVASFDGPVPVPLPRATCARLRVLPLWRHGDVVGLAMSDPTDDTAVHEIGRLAGSPIERLLVNDDDLDLALRSVFGRTPAPTTMGAFGSSSSVSSWNSLPPTTPITPPAPVQPPLPPVLPPAPAPSTPPAPALASPPPTTTSPISAQTSQTPTPTLRPTLPVGDATAPMPRSPAAPPTVEVRASVPAAAAPSDPSELFVDPIPEAISIVDDEPFLSQSSGVFATNPVEVIGPGPAAELPVTRVTMPPVLPPPPVEPAPAVRAPAAAVSELTNEIQARDFLSDPTALVVALAPAAPAVVSDDKTIPNDSVLFVMRVLLVGEGTAIDVVAGELRRRIRQFQHIALPAAARELEHRRYDVVIVIDPPDTVAGAQQLALLASRARGGVVVVSDTTDHARLPGVRTVQTRPPDGELADLVVDLLQRRARGE